MLKCSRKYCFPKGGKVASSPGGSLRVTHVFEDAVMKETCFQSGRFTTTCPAVMVGQDVSGSIFKI